EATHRSAHQTPPDVEWKQTDVRCAESEMQTGRIARGRAQRQGRIAPGRVQPAIESLCREALFATRRTRKSIPDEGSRSAAGDEISLAQEQVVSGYRRVA